MRTLSDIPTVIIIDDDQFIVSSLKRVLDKLAITIKTFTNPLDALSFVTELVNAPLLILSDQRMPNIEGCDLLKEIHKKHPSTYKVILSSYQDFKKVSEGLQNKVIDKFVCKPWSNKELRALVQKQIDNQDSSTTQSRSNSVETPYNFHGMISSSPAMKQIFDCIAQASKSRAPIFISGETGTGKELCAKACHESSTEQPQPFIAVNCANFDANLMESQLFGHKKGAFTGALADQKGLFALANKGSIFLDEITTLPLSLQAKLLRVIQEREFTPLGASNSQPFDSLIISASSTPLSEAVSNNEFREDLFYRLNVISFALPPLRERNNDVSLLALHFLKRFSKQHSKAFKQFSRDAIQLIGQYAWPGNIRQLENTIQSIVILNDGETITADMVINLLSMSSGENELKEPTSIATQNTQALSPRSQHSNTPSKILPLSTIERNAIEQAIDYCNGNIPKAASLLDVSPSTIYRKIQQWNKH